MDLIELENVEILLDNDKTIYQCGQTVSGAVSIALNGELKMSAVKIVLRAMSEVKWVEVYGTMHHRESYSDCELYLNDVYEIPENIRTTTLTKGSQILPFLFKLPDILSIPSSVDLCHGFIHYWIEVIINDDQEFSKDYYCVKKYLTVENPIRYGLHISVGSGTEKDIGILYLANGGNVRIDAFIRRKGFIPGETIEVHCLVTNASSLGVTPRASFYETHIFMTRERHATIVHTNDAVIGEKVKARETRDQIISIQLPTELALSIKTRLISVKYFIHVTLDIPFATDLHLNLPIIITNEYALNKDLPLVL